jgi:hypothetical protein
MVNFPKKLPPSGRDFSNSLGTEVSSDTESSSGSVDEGEESPAKRRRANVAPGGQSPQRSDAGNLGQTSNSLGVPAPGWLPSEPPGRVEMRQSPTPQFPQGRVWSRQTSPLPQADPETLAQVARMREESILARQLETPSTSEPGAVPALPEGRAQSVPVLEVPAHLKGILEMLASPTPARPRIPDSPGRGGANATEAFPIPSSPEPEQLNWHPEIVFQDDGTDIVGPAPTAEAIENLLEAILAATDENNSWLDDEYREILIQNLGPQASFMSDLHLVASAVALWREQEATGVESDNLAMYAYDAVENLGELALTTPEVARALDEFTDARPALPLVAQRCVEVYNDWDEREQDVPELLTFVRCGPMLLDIAEKWDQFDESEEVPSQLDESNETDSDIMQGDIDLLLNQNEIAEPELGLDENVGEPEVLNENPVTLQEVVDAARAVSYEAGRTILDYCFPGGQVASFPPGQPPAPPQ